MPLLNQKQTAAALDCSAAYLSRMKKEGRITYGDPERKLYDVDQVRAALRRTGDIRQVIATETRRQTQGKPPIHILDTLRANVRRLDASAVLPLGDWIALISWSANEQVIQRLSALPPTMQVNAAELASLITGDRPGLSGAAWLSEACDWGNLAGTLPLGDDE